MRRLSRGQPWLLLGAGLLISSVTAVVPLFFGGSLLESGAVTIDLPLFGTVKLTSALFFDIGVYLVVVGLAMMVFESFGDEPSASIEDDMSVLMAFPRQSLFGIGTYLLMQRKLSRLIIGLGLIGHGANIVFVTTSKARRAPIVGTGDQSDFADPVPQALVLTAIVISFGVTALLLALAYRSWLLTDDDEVADDPDDRAISKASPDIEVDDAGWRKRPKKRRRNRESSRDRCSCRRRSFCP